MERDELMDFLQDIVEAATDLSNAANSLAAAMEREANQPSVADLCTRALYNMKFSGEQLQESQFVVKYGQEVLTSLLDDKFVYRVVDEATYIELTEKGVKYISELYA